MMLYWTGSIVSAVVGSSIVKFVRCHSWFIHCLVKRKLHFCLARNKDFKFTLCVGGSYLLFKLGDFLAFSRKPMISLLQDCILFFMWIYMYKLED